MSEDRRTASRAHVPGVQATYETANGERREAEVVDLGPGGLFLATDSPPAVGKRVSLEIVVNGEPSPWSALGRVVWTRAAAEGDQPAGMAIKLIDVEDSVVVAIQRLVAMRERTEPGVGAASSPPPPPQAPAPERTVLGLGAPPPADLPATPEAFAPDGRAVAAEQPGVVTPRAEPPSPGVVGAIRREPSIAIDLVSKKSQPPASPRPPAPPVQSAAMADEGEIATVPAKRGRTGAWLLVVAVLVLAGAAYAFREQLLSVWNGVS